MPDLSEIYRLIYVSQERQAITDAEIGHILDASLSNNYERFITGFLTHNHGRFMQVLEGPEDEVRGLFQTITEDQRHACVTQIVGEHSDRRIFPDWSMNYFRVDNETGPPSMLVRTDEVEELMPANTPKPVLYLFTRFMAQR